MKEVLMPQTETNQYVTFKTNRPIFIISKETGLIEGMIVYNNSTDKWYASTGNNVLINGFDIKESLLLALNVLNDYYLSVDIMLPIREQDKDIAKVAVKLNDGNYIYPGTKQFKRNDLYEFAVNKHFDISDRIYFEIFDSAIINGQEVLLVNKTALNYHDLSYPSVLIDRKNKYKELSSHISGKLHELCYNNIYEDEHFSVIFKQSNQSAEFFTNKPISNIMEDNYTRYDILNVFKTK